MSFTNNIQPLQQDTSLPFAPLRLCGRPVSRKGAKAQRKQPFAYLLLILLALTCSCQRTTSSAGTLPAASPAQPSPTQQANTSEVKTFYGTGVVTKVVLENPYDKSLSSVELDHEDIEGLMPAMRMEFPVKNRSLLKGIKVGDKVDFTIEEKDRNEVISDIDKKR